MEERERWLSIIPRDIIPDIKNAVVCEKHWPGNYLTKVDYGKERARHPPLDLHALNQAKLQHYHHKKKYRQSICRGKEVVT